MTIQNARSNTAGNVPPGSADGQFLINQADDVLFTHKPDGTTRRFLLPKRRGVADSLVTIGINETYIGIASLTTSRAVGLPPAQSYPGGHPLAIVDESGSVSPTVTLTLTPQGTDKINGLSTLALATAFGGALLYSDGVSKWTAIALPAGGASNALLYVAQSLTGAQQDQARANLSGPMAGAQNATTTLTPLDFDRDQFVTGTSTLTMPLSVAPGWRSGIVLNDNAVTGLVTLAVPSGHSLDGTTNGVTTLSPFQRARLQLVSAGVWRTVWIDRAPIVAIISASGVTSADANLPVGYSRFSIDVSNVASSTNGDTFSFRLSDNGSAGIKSGASDYAANRIAAGGAGTGVAGGQTIASAGALMGGIGNAFANLRGIGKYSLTPNPSPSLVGINQLYDNTPQNVITEIGVAYTGATSGAIGRANLIRFLMNTGNLTLNATIKGEP